MCFSKSSVKSNDELKRPLNFDSLDESLWNDKCDYIDPQNVKNLNPSGLNLVVLQLNIRSILSHITELKMLILILETKNSRVNIILLCETFLNKSTEKLVKIPGYTLICNSRSKSKGGGTAILLRNGINYKRRKDIEVFKEKHAEMTIIEIIAKDGKKIIVGSMYRPLNTDPMNFRMAINTISSTSLKENKRDNTWHGP